MAFWFISDVLTVLGFGDQPSTSSDSLLGMDLVSWFIIVFLLIIVAFICLLFYSGMFANIEIKTQQPPYGQMTVAYKFGRGPYKNCGALFGEVQRLVPNLTCFGVYYDDPNEVTSTHLRYCVGVILAHGNDVPEKKEEELLVENGYKLFMFPAVDHVVLTYFPFTCMLSIFIAIARVYPKLGDYVLEHGLCAHPMMEIYEASRILFMAPLSKQDKFYVPEALAEMEEEEEDEEEDDLSVEGDTSGEVDYSAEFEGESDSYQGENFSSSSPEEEQPPSFPSVDEDRPGEPEVKHDNNGRISQGSSTSSFEELAIENNGNTEPLAKVPEE